MAPTQAKQPGYSRPRRFADRAAAGRDLAGLLVDRYRDAPPLVLGLPRGGVPVAAEVAAMLGAELDVFVVRKLGVPGHAELAMGAVASGGVRVFNDDVLARLHWLDKASIEAVTRRESAELARREQAYRGARSPLELAGRTVLLVDDGIATGATMRAAVRAVRGTASAVVVAVPVASTQAVEQLQSVADEVVAAQVPLSFGAVGSYYADFSQVTDDEVRAILAG